VNPSAKALVRSHQIDAGLAQMQQQFWGLPSARLKNANRRINEFAAWLGALRLDLAPSFGHADRMLAELRYPTGYFTRN